MRILAIDYGKKRTGIAVTDPFQIIAYPFDTIETIFLHKFLDNYLTQNKVEEVIIGHPKCADNTDAEIFSDIKIFAEKFEKKYPKIKIVFWDERYTSKLAVKAMIEGGYSKKDRKEKKNIDKIAATIILQEYLETKQDNPKL